MSLRFGNIYNDGFYHVFNRGVDRRIIFNDEEDYQHFLLLLRLLNSHQRINSITKLIENDLLVQTLKEVELETPLVEYYGYSLLSNHFHLILKQVQENGVSIVMKKVSSAYAQYFNRKNKRRGTLFESRFKYITIEDDNHLLKMMSYVNRNHTIHGATPPFSCTSGHNILMGNILGFKHFKTHEIVEHFSSLKAYTELSTGILNEVIEQRKNKERYNGDLID